jgi:hypothetical protein
MNENGMVDVSSSIVSICDVKSSFGLSIRIGIVDSASSSSPEVSYVFGIPIMTSDKKCVIASSSGMNVNSTISAVCFYSIELVIEFHHAIRIVKLYDDFGSSGINITNVAGISVHESR